MSGFWSQRLAGQNHAAGSSSNSNSVHFCTKRLSFWMAAVSHARSWTLTQAKGIKLQVLTARLPKKHNILPEDKQSYTPSFLSSPFIIRVPFFLLFGFNKGTLHKKGQKHTTQEPRQPILHSKTEPCTLISPSNRLYAYARGRLRYVLAIA